MNNDANFFQTRFVGVAAVDTLPFSKHLTCPPDPTTNYKTTDFKFMNCVSNQLELLEQKKHYLSKTA